MYLLGLLELALEYYILTNLPYTTSLIVYFIWSIIFAIIINPLYLKYAKLKVKTIRNAKRNRKKNQYELNQICNKVGGTNSAMALLTFFAFYGVLIYLSMYELPNSTIKQSYDYITAYIEEIKAPVYDGVIDRLSYDVDNVLKINIPEGFTKDQGKIYKYVLENNGKEESKTCSLTISRIAKFKDPKDYLNQFIKYEKLDTTPEETTIHNITWYEIKQEKRSFTKTLDAAYINGNMVLLEYNSGKETEQGVCEAHYNTIINSIELNK